MVVFNEQLQYSHVIGKGKLKGLTGGVAVDNRGHLYVADCSGHYIKKFNMDGSLITQFGTHGRGNGQLSSPHGLVISKKGQLYVCDRDNHRMQVFQNYKFVFSFGRMGSEPGALLYPNDATLNNAETQLFVADRSNNRIQVFTPDGKFVYIFGKFTDMPYELK